MLLALLQFPLLLVHGFLELLRSSLTREDTGSHVQQPVQTEMPVNTLTFKAPFTVGRVYEILTLLTEAEHEAPAPPMLALSHFNGTEIL